MSTISVNLNLPRPLTKHGRSSINSYLENLSLRLLKPGFFLYFDCFLNLKIFMEDRPNPRAIIDTSETSSTGSFYVDIPVEFLNDKFIKQPKGQTISKILENAPEVKEIPLEKNVVPNDDHIVKALYYKIDEFKEVYKKTLMEHIQNPENLEKYIKKGFYNLIPTDQDSLLFLEKLQIDAQFPAIIMDKAGVDFIIVEMTDGNLFTF
jgi:hypothetical protein